MVAHREAKTLLGNLKHLWDLNWRWLTRLKSIRQSDPDRMGNVDVEHIEVGDEGWIVHIKGFGMVKVFRIVTDFDEADHWTSDDLTMTEASVKSWLGRRLGSRNIPGALKQCCAEEKC